MLLNLRQMLKHISWAMSRILRVKPGLTVTLLIISVVEGSAPAALVYITQHLINGTIAAVGQGTAELYNLIPWLCAMLFFSLLTFDVMYHVREPIRLRISQTLNYVLDTERLKLAAEMPLLRMEDSETSNLLNRSDNPGNKISRILHSLLWATQHLVQLITISLFFTSISPWLPPLLIVMQIPSLFLAGKSEKLWMDVTYAQTEEQRKADYVSGLLTGRKEQKELRLLDLRSEFQHRWRERRHHVRTASLAVRRTITFLQIPSDWINLAAMAVILFASAYQLADRSMTVGLFVAVFQASYSYFEAYHSVLYGIRETLQGAGEAGFVREFLQSTSVQINDDSHKRSLKHAFPLPMRSGIKLDRVSFRYPERDPILKEVSLHIRPGEHIALVGVNGAGKSTLVKLLMGLYEPVGGTITVDGTAYADIAPNTLRDNVTAAFQDYYNFEFTLAESVGIGQPASLGNKAGMDLSAIEAAAAIGGADEVHNRLEQGWEQPIGHVLDGGVGLSGGQWQRIALSRALMRRSQLLILDEPTAAMDPKIEAELYARFMTIMRDRSVFIVSHRLGSARIADRILVLSDGVIAEEGSHEQLLTAGGIYSRMWEEQAQWYRD